MPSHAPEHSQPDPAPTSAILRSATRDRHQRIERVPVLGRLFAQDYSLDEYRTLLARLYGFYGVVEPTLAEVVGVTVPWTTFIAERPRHRLLVEDLANLGMDAATLGRLARCATPPSWIKDLNHALGTLYVLEGAALGGLVIRTRLNQHFGTGIESALRFYTGYGDRTPTVWDRFKTALDTHFAADSANGYALVESANATFDHLTEWLEDTEVAPEI
ncbi:biliverdin-producing heme oxygenase [Methylomagnum sp.]